MIEYPNYKSIEGIYTDKNNKNKTAKITESKDGKLVYSDGRYGEISEEYGNELISQGASGYFVLNDDKSVSWSGAEDKKNKKCLFVRDKDE